MEAVHEGTNPDAKVPVLSVVVRIRQSGKIDSFAILLIIGIFETGI